MYHLGEYRKGNVNTPTYLNSTKKKQNKKQNKKVNKETKKTSIKKSIGNERMSKNIYVKGENEEHMQAQCKTLKLKRM